MTFSLVARCAASGMFGIVIASSSPAVAARCSHARAGIGAVASQNVTDPDLGTAVLDGLASGCTAEQAIENVRSEAAFMEYRQLLAVDAKGGSAVHSGAEALGTWADAHCENLAAGGNLLADECIPRAMIDGFLAAGSADAADAAEGFGDCLLSALRAGLAAGGEAGPVHSAGMKIVHRLQWPCVDLRCDWSEDCPIASLAATWKIYRPQVQAYIQRALDPRQAPSYGVPGDK